MLVWINNNHNFILSVLFILVSVTFISFYIIKLFFDTEILSIITSLLTICCFLTFSSAMFLSYFGTGNLAAALRGEYGQHLVETRQFYSDRTSKELQKLSKGKTPENVTVWCNKKKYTYVEIKQREGNEEKIVFAYPKPIVKGIKVVNKTPYVYVYHKKLKYRFD